MLACRDGSKHSNLDCILPESFEGDKIVCFAGVITMEDPHFVFFGEESCAVENTHVDVNGVLVHDQVALEVCKSNAGKEARGEYLNPH